MLIGCEGTRFKKKPSALKSETDKIWKRKIHAINKLGNVRKFVYYPEIKYRKAKDEIREDNQHCIIPEQTEKLVAREVAVQ